LKKTPLFLEKTVVFLEILMFLEKTPVFLENSMSTSREKKESIIFLAKYVQI
jgi:hypothetical protein